MTVQAQIQLRSMQSVNWDWPLNSGTLGHATMEHPDNVKSASSDHCTHTSSPITLMVSTVSSLFSKVYLSLKAQIKPLPSSTFPQSHLISAWLKATENSEWTPLLSDLPTAALSSPSHSPPGHSSLPEGSYPKLQIVLLPILKSSSELSLFLD